MVFTLAVSMMMGPSMTASAAGLSDLYKIEDGWGNPIANKENTRTGTISATETHSGVLTATAMLQGIELDDNDIQFELPDDATDNPAKLKKLTASLDWGKDKDNKPIVLSGKDKELNDELLKRLRWSSSNTEVVALRVYNTENGNSYFGKEARNEIRLVPKGAGKATVTVSLDSAKYDIHYTATANVTVEEYADALEFDQEKLGPNGEAFSGSTLDLNDYVIRKVKGEVKAATSDEITYILLDDGKSDKNKKARATLKNNILTLKSTTDTDPAHPVVVRAVGKYAHSIPDGKITIRVGTNATAVTFSADIAKPAKNDALSEVKNGKTFTWYVNDKMEATVTAEVTGWKKEGKKVTDGDCTDKFTWSSAKPEVIEIDDDLVPSKAGKNKYVVKVKAVSAGKAQIIAKASSGPSFKLSATVSADLTSIELKPSMMTETELYSGQTVDLNDWVTQKFAANGKDDFIDAGLTWSLVDDNGVNNTPAVKAAKQITKLNAKTGILEIKPDTKKVKKINIAVKNAKKTVSGKDKTSFGINKITFTLIPVSVDSIEIIRGTSQITPFKIEAEWKGNKFEQQPKKPEDTINVGATRTYTLKASGYKLDNDNKKTGGEIDLTSALGWTASGNKKIVVASRGKNGAGVLKAVKKGTATITASAASLNTSGKPVTVKVTFKDAVKAPTKTVTLSAKNKGIAAEDGIQTIPITVKLDKGTTTNAKKNIKWEAWSINKDKVSTPLNENVIANGKLMTNFKGFVGQQIKVTATTTDGGVKGSIYFNVVTPSPKKIEFKSTDVEVKKGNTIEVKAKDPNATSVTIDLENEDGNGANVTYTVSKPGIAFILQDSSKSNKYGIKVYGLAKGTAKVTATTSDGKKTTLTIKVTE